MQKQKNPLPKRSRTMRATPQIDNAQRRAAQAKWGNDHHKAIAGYYFDDTPTLPNLAKGTYHWLMGNVFRENEDPNVTEMRISDWIAGPAGKGASIVTNAKKLGQLLRRGVNKETIRVVTEKAKQAGRSFKKGIKSAIVGDLDDVEEETRTVRNAINQADDAAPIIVRESGQAAQAANTVPVAGGGYTQGIVVIGGGAPQQAAQATSSLASSTNSVVNQGTRAVGQAQRFKKKAAAANKAREAAEKELRQVRNTVQEANQRATTSESRAAELQRKVEELKQAAAERTAQAGRAAQTGQAAGEAVQTGQTVTQAGQTAGQTAAQTSRGFWGNVGRVLWETEKNNFGPYYTVRNTFRVPGYMAVVPWAAGALRGSGPRYLEYAGEAFEKGRRRASGDTTTVATPPIEKKDTVFINQSDSSQVSRSNTNPDTQFNPGKQVINNDSLTQEQFQALMNELF